VRVQRAGAPRPSRRERPETGQRRGGLRVDELEVPEFLPNT
jgi:hypothetical protein